MSATAPQKPIYLSKTFWLQVVALLSLAVPAVRAWLDANPEQFVAALAAANILLRFATSGKISLLGAGETPGDDDNEGRSGGLPLPLWIMVGTLAGLLGTLPACSWLSEMPIRATVQVEEGAVSYSSKSGLEMQYRPNPSKRPRVRSTK